jgi:hypothetical protein
MTEWRYWFVRWRCQHCGKVTVIPTFDTQTLSLHLCAWCRESLDIPLDLIGWGLCEKFPRSEIT